jgi:hypothetical protein
MNTVLVVIVAAAVVALLSYCVIRWKDRRIVYAAVLVTVVIPLVWRSNPAVEVSPEVRQAYASIDKVPLNGVVMISIDYDGGSEAELQPMLLAIARHCFTKNLKVILTGQWPNGLPLGQGGMEEMARACGKEYGKDFVNIGYRPGRQALMVGIGLSGLRQYFTTDFRGVPLDSFSFMRSVRNYGQIDRLVGLEAGAEGDYWVQYAGAQFGLRIVLGVTGVMATSAYPYLQAGQIDGLIGGLRGAAEYETLVQHPGRGIWGMNSQSYVHLLIILFVILGNVTFYLDQRKRPKAKPEGKAEAG